MKSTVLYLALAITLLSSDVLAVDALDIKIADKLAAVANAQKEKTISSLVSGIKSYAKRFAYDNLQKFQVESKIHESFQFGLYDGSTGSTGLVVRPFMSFNPLLYGNSYENVSDYKLISTSQETYSYSLTMAHYGVKNQDGTYSIRTGLGWTVANGLTQYETVTKDGKTEKVEREFKESEIEDIDSTFVKKAAAAASTLMRKGLFIDDGEEIIPAGSKLVFEDKALRSSVIIRGVQPEKVVDLVHSIIVEHEANSNDSDFLKEVNMIVQSGITETLAYKFGTGGYLSINLTSFALGGSYYDVEIFRRL